MTPPRPDGLRSLALNNPQLLSRDDLVHDFCARTGELHTLVRSLRDGIHGTAQHHLVLGQRGMGKTTLLHRLAYAIEDDAELAGVWLPLVFPEEQYNITGLAALWLNVLDALSDTLERTGNIARAEALDELIDHLPRADERTLEQTARTAALGVAAELGRRLVLLLDNLDLILDRLDLPGQWALRELLEQGDKVVVIGASTAATEATYDYGKPFYDFFRVHHLVGLTDDEARDLVLRIADRHGNEAVRALVLAHPERVRGVRVLSGGNPRTIAMLYGVLAEGGGEQGLRGPVEALLDRYTPLYKARFEELPAQAQVVVDALCLLWDPAPASAIAEKARLDINKVSSQLTRLRQQGLIEEVPHVDARTGEPLKRSAFQIAERFFNIWYLMRASRRVRRRLVWLVHTLEALLGPGELLEQATRLALVPEGGKVDVEFAAALLDRVGEGFERDLLVLRTARACVEQGVPVGVVAEEGEAVYRIAEDIERFEQARLTLENRFDNEVARQDWVLLLPYWNRLTADQQREFGETLARSATGCETLLTALRFVNEFSLDLLPDVEAHEQSRLMMSVQGDIDAFVQKLTAVRGWSTDELLVCLDARMAEIALVLPVLFHSVGGGEDLPTTEDLRTTIAKGLEVASDPRALLIVHLGAALLGGTAHLLTDLSQALSTCTAADLTSGSTLQLLLLLRRLTSPDLLPAALPLLSNWDAHHPSWTPHLAGWTAFVTHDDRRLLALAPEVRATAELLRDAFRSGSNTAPATS
jgi:hypothetical protein